MDELNELMNTITSTTKLMNLKDSDLSLDMLNELKSDNSTIIQSSAVRSLLEEEKKRRQAIEEENNTEMDKSFYTSSLNLNKKDFEGLFPDQEKTKKKNATEKIILTIILILVVVITGVVLWIKFL